MLSEQEIKTRRFRSYIVRYMKEKRKNDRERDVWKIGTKIERDSR